MAGLKLSIISVVYSGFWRYASPNRGRVVGGKGESPRVKLRFNKVTCLSVPSHCYAVVSHAEGSTAEPYWHRYCGRQFRWCYRYRFLVLISRDMGESPMVKLRFNKLTCFSVPMRVLQSRNSLRRVHCGASLAPIYV